ncbi:MAG: threonine aldolase family protein [Gemmatimonadota bacterium]
MTHSADRLRSFASDNTAGVHPAVMAAVLDANRGAARSYGADEWTARATALLKAEFGADAEPYFVLNGTAANVLGLSAVLRPHEAVISTEMAHVNVDECGAPERYIGCKLLTVPAADGKLVPELIRSRLIRVGDEHHVRARVVSLSLATEAGTVYRPEELRAITAFAREHDLLVHMDGARLANAAASLDVPLKALTTEVGIDLLSLGATKNGAMGAEAVVFLRPGLGESFKYVRKQGMQLASKMRFVAAQFAAMFEDGLWRRNAAHANAMARRLADAVRHLPGVTITQPVEANAVFATLPAGAIAELQQRFYFYVWNGRINEVRWMTAFDTPPEAVDEFAAAIERAVNAAQG